MKNFLKELHKQMVWAILWNHEYSIRCHTTTYMDIGVWVAMVLIICLFWSLSYGLYLAAGIFLVAIVVAVCIAEYVYKIIKNGTNDQNG